MLSQMEIRERQWRTRSVRWIALVAALIGLAQFISSSGHAQSPQRPRGSGAAIIDNLAGDAKRGRGGIIPRASVTNIDDVQHAVRRYCEDQTGGIYGSNVSWTFSASTTRCIVVRPNMFTNILFPEWEKVIEASLGDDRGFKVVRQGSRPNVLTVSTSGEMTGADTTLTVFGDAVNGASSAENAPWGSSHGGRNVYSFILISIPVSSEQLANAVVRVNAGRPSQGLLSFESPTASSVPGGAFAVARNNADPSKRVRDDESGVGARRDAGAERDDGAPEWLREIPFDIGKLRFNDYEVRVEEGEDAADISPVRVFHDGTFTYFDFGEGDGGRADRNKRPVVLQVVDEIDSRVNVLTTGPTGNIIRVEAIGDFTLKNGRRIVCVNYIGAKPDSPDDGSSTDTS